MGLCGIASYWCIIILMVIHLIFVSYSHIIYCTLGIIFFNSPTNRNQLRTIQICIFYLSFEREVQARPYKHSADERGFFLFLRRRPSILI